MFSIEKSVMIGIVILAATIAHGQKRFDDKLPRAEVALDYSYLRANASPSQCGCFSMNGGSAEVAIHAYRGLSAVVDLTGEHTGTTSIPGQALSLLTITGGPRFSYPLSRHVTPFVQGLVGGAHGFDGPFPNGSATIPTSATSIAVFLGGGLDFVVNHRFAVRAAQVDYGLTHLPNGVNNSQNLLRVSAGLVFRLR